MQAEQQFLRILFPDGTPDQAQLNALIGRYKWLLSTRLLRQQQAPEADSILKTIAPLRTESLLSATVVDVDALTTVSNDELIDRFLQEDDLRIVANEGEAVEEVRMEAEFDDEDELVSEPLAEIYAAQGLYDQAIAIYRKLSLLNSEKSIYFAELIDALESKKQRNNN